MVVSSASRAFRFVWGSRSTGLECEVKCERDPLVACADRFYRAPDFEGPGRTWDMGYAKRRGASWVSYLVPTLFVGPLWAKVPSCLVEIS